MGPTRDIKNRRCILVFQQLTISLNKKLHQYCTNRLVGFSSSRYFLLTHATVTMQSTQPHRAIPRALLEINNREFRAILKMAGYTCKEFGNYIERSHTFVSELGMSDGHIPSRWIRALIEFISREAYELHLERIRLRNVKKSNN